jgi:2-iminobutanoate/2-iminopropanoate deaminase
MHEAIGTRNAPEPRGHYSQAVRMGNFLFVSGQLPLVRDGQMINGSISEECAQALENIRAIVEAAEASVRDIVQCTIYITDIAHWPEVEGIYGTFFSEVPVLPARAIVPVKELPYGARIEIQAIAFVFGQ